MCSMSVVILLMSDEMERVCNNRMAFGCRCYPRVCLETLKTITRGLSE